MINGRGVLALELGAGEAGKSSDAERRVMVTPIAIQLNGKTFDRIIRP